MPKLLLSVMSFMLLSAACSPAAQNTPTQPPAVRESQSTNSSGAQSSSSAYTARPWATLPLVDARTGETFTLADYAGKTVFVEPMATWCTRCRAQIPNVEAARQQVSADQYVFVGLSVAENVDNATLASYVDEQGWNFRFAVATEELTQALVDEFGRTVVTPPSTPHFIIRPDGSPGPIMTGSLDSAALIAELQEASGG